MISRTVPHTAGNRAQRSPGQAVLPSRPAAPSGRVRGTSVRRWMGAAGGVFGVVCLVMFLSLSSRRPSTVSQPSLSGARPTTTPAQREELVMPNRLSRQQSESTPAPSLSPLQSSALSRERDGMVLYASGVLLVPSVAAASVVPTVWASPEQRHWNPLSADEAVFRMVQRMRRISTGLGLGENSSKTDNGTIRQIPLPRIANNRRLPNGKLLRAGDEAHERLLQGAVGKVGGNSNDEASLRRYRNGGVGYLLPPPRIQQQPSSWTRDIADRAASCAEIRAGSLETPVGGQYDPLFVSYTQRRQKEREHHCFSPSSMFLFLKPNPLSSLAQQIETILTFLFVCSLSGRTAVVPPLYLTSGRRIRLSDIADVRYLFAATAASRSQPLCVLEWDEFVDIQRSWLGHHRVDGGAKEAAHNNASIGAHDEFTRVSIDSGHCITDWGRGGSVHGESFLRQYPSLDWHCSEITYTYMPHYATSYGAATQLEEALDAALKATTSSFSRHVAIDHLIVDIIAMTMPHIAAVFSSASGASPSWLLWRCLWSLFQPHPFVRRAAHLAEAVVEETFPSGIGRDLTLQERESGVAVGLINASLGYQASDGSSFTFSSTRRRDISVWVNPAVGWGVVCSDELLKARRAASAESSNAEWTCTLTERQMQQLSSEAVDNNRSGIIIFHGPDGDAEARRMSLLLRRSMLQRQQAQHRRDEEDQGFHPPTSPPRVMTQDYLFQRNNRLTKYMKVVQERRKLYVGAGNALLLRGHSSAAGVARPFRIQNVFASEPQLLEDLTKLWICVGSSKWLSLAPWSSITRVVNEKRPWGG